MRTNISPCQYSIDLISNSFNFARLNDKQFKIFSNFSSIHFICCSLFYHLPFYTISLPIHPFHRQTERTVYCHGNDLVSQIDRYRKLELLNVLAFRMEEEEWVDCVLDKDNINYRMQTMTLFPCNMLVVGIFNNK